MQIGVSKNCELWCCISSEQFVDSSKLLWSRLIVPSSIPIFVLPRQATTHTLNSELQRCHDLSRILNILISMLIILFTDLLICLSISYKHCHVIQISIPKRNFVFVWSVDEKVEVILSTYHVQTKKSKPSRFKLG